MDGLGRQIGEKPYVVGGKLELESEIRVTSVSYFSSFFHPFFSSYIPKGAVLDTIFFFKKGFK